MCLTDFRFLDTTKLSANNDGIVYISKNEVINAIIIRLKIP
jgi:hypothetical protein